MCQGTVHHACHHIRTRRITCRKTWRHRAGLRLCLPLVAYFCGEGPSEACDEVRPEKSWTVASSCADCQAAEAAGVQTRGRTHNRYVSRLTPAAINESRRRMEDAERNEEIERNMYRDERIELLVKRRQHADAEKKRKEERLKAFPAMPGFNHPPLGVLWDDSPVQQGAHDAHTYREPDGPETQIVPDPWPIETDHRENRAERSGGGYGGFEVSSYGYDQYRRDEEKLANDGINPYRPQGHEPTSTRPLAGPEAVPVPPTPLSAPSRRSRDSGRGARRQDPPPPKPRPAKREHRPQWNSHEARKFKDQPSQDSSKTTEPSGLPSSWWGSKNPHKHLEKRAMKLAERRGGPLPPRLDRPERSLPSRYSESREESPMETGEARLYRPLLCPSNHTLDRRDYPERVPFGGQDSRRAERRGRR
ncbi:hypothetical protein Cob_v001028 [Colletotrichum orbiculare MAFF 240422]|uniref:Uncharacterized protein n=1 Tax=Colletotrichum orbiculare (strain 104-T / ATCC 96160 / CBS 514.97 / LARS 414 / MAFF 240422) TaxID=1213857 RepID=N4VK95_COLOR|nr:hypothetical protein Cob_v001028 [Colletotrichum orbiculare MAFF 240422]